jgi:predicted glycoside hydrolase/deacetylase ChbG (UPF0249 family)
MADTIRLIVRADDMGMTHGCNAAVQSCFEEGILTSAAIQAPAPWAAEAALLCRCHPGWCIGAHLTAIAEWVGYRWRPVLPPEKVSTLVDEDGFFRQTPQDFYSSRIDYDQLAAEFTAQVRLLQDRWGVRLCYVDAHYIDGSNPRDPAYFEVLRDVAARFRLPLSEHEGETVVTGIYAATPDQKEDTVLRRLRDLTPGLWLMVHHVLEDASESQALRHAEPAALTSGTVAAHRAAEARVLRSDRVKAAIREKGIRLVSYRNLA